MPPITEWAVTAFLLTSTVQPETVTWLTLLEKLQETIPVPQVWVALSLIGIALLFVLDVGDKLSGIFGWLGVKSPFRRAELFDSDDMQRSRRNLLRRVKFNVDGQLANSLHKQVKLDLDMEDQQQQIGKHKNELIPEDHLEISSITTKFFLNRDFQSFGGQTDQPLVLDSTQKIVDIFDREDIQRQLLILGEPGAGKTTELLHLAQDLLKRALENEDFPIPVLLELTTWEERKTIEEWIADRLSMPKADGGYAISKSVVNQWLQDDDIIPLLDGLDEIGLRRQKKCIEAINKFLIERSPYGLSVCCRREEYQAAQVQINALKGAVYLKPLREDQIEYFFRHLNRSSMWKRIQSSSKMMDLARTPLFLSMLVEAYQGKPINSNAELFDAFIAKKLEKPNAGVYHLDEKNNSQQTYQYLVWLANKLENTNKSDFLIEGLQPSFLRQCQEELELYKIIISLIHFLFFLLIIGLIFWLRIWLNFKMITGGNDSLLLGLSFGLSFVVNGMIIISLGLSKKWRNWLDSPIQPSEKLNFSFSKGLSSGIRTGLSAGIFFGLLFGVLSGPSFGLAAGVVYGLILGLIQGLLKGLYAQSINEKDFPNQGIWQSLRNSLIGGLIVSFIFGIFFGLIAGLPAGLIAGIVFGTLFAMVSGLEAVIKHVSLRIVLTKSGHTPWNYARFLNYAVELRFIRQVGGRYRFVHGLLRKHFAEGAVKVG